MTVWYLSQTFPVFNGIECQVICCCFRADKFWENMVDDVEAYANHAGRKTIDETDMYLLLQRYVHGNKYFMSLTLSLWETHYCVGKDLNIQLGLFFMYYYIYYPLNITK